MLKFKENKNDFKIRQYAVYRTKYKKELEAIWKIQLEKNDDFFKLNTDKKILQKLVETLYPTQAKAKMAKLNEFLSKDLLHIISINLYNKIKLWNLLIVNGIDKKV